MKRLYIILLCSLLALLCLSSAFAGSTDHLPPEIRDYFSASAFDGMSVLGTVNGQEIGGRDACWLRVSLFSPEIGHRAPSFVGRPRVMTVVSPAPPPLATSARVMSLPYEREAPHLKHLATLGLIHARRAARAAGFDDALFVDRNGCVSEGALWNIGFVQGDRIVWPQASMLAGVAQALIHRGLAREGLVSERRPVALSDVAAFDGAFLCNSATPVCLITAVDAVVFQPDPAILTRIAQAWTAQPPQILG